MACEQKCASPSVLTSNTFTTQTLVPILTAFTSLFGVLVPPPTIKSFNPGTTLSYHFNGRKAPVAPIANTLQFEIRYGGKVIATFAKFNLPDREPWDFSFKLVFKANGKASLSGEFLSIATNTLLTTQQTVSFSGQKTGLVLDVLARKGVVNVDDTDMSMVGGEVLNRYVKSKAAARRNRRCGGGSPPPAQPANQADAVLAAGATSSPIIPLVFPGGLVVTPLTSKPITASLRGTSIGYFYAHGESTQAVNNYRFSFTSPNFSSPMVLTYPTTTSGKWEFYAILNVVGTDVRAIGSFFENGKSSTTGVLAQLDSGNTTLPLVGYAPSVVTFGGAVDTYGNKLQGASGIIYSPRASALSSGNQSLLVNQARTSLNAVAFDRFCVGPCDSAVVARGSIGTGSVAIVNGALKHADGDSSDAVRVLVTLGTNNNGGCAEGKFDFPNTFTGAATQMQFEVDVISRSKTGVCVNVTQKYNKQATTLEVCERKNAYFNVAGASNFTVALQTISANSKPQYVVQDATVSSFVAPL